MCIDGGKTTYSLAEILSKVDGFTHCLKVVNDERFKVVFFNLSMGLNFLQTSAMAQVSNKTGQGSNMTGLNEGYVRQIFQEVFATNLENLRVISSDKRAWC